MARILDLRETVFDPKLWNPLSWRSPQDWSRLTDLHFYVGRTVDVPVVGPNAADAWHDVFTTTARWPLRYHLPAVDIARDAAIHKGLGKHTIELPVQTSKGERTAWVTFPDPEQFPEPRGIIINLHGFSDNAAFHGMVTGMARQGTADGYVVVHPQGEKGLIDITADLENPLENPVDLLTKVLSNQMPAWEGMEGSDLGTPLDKGDVEFLSKLIDGSALPPIGPSGLPLASDHVVVGGFSNGAMMAYKLAQLIPNLVIAPVGGLMPFDFEPTHDQPIPAVIFHGRQDPLLNVHGQDTNATGFGPIEAGRRLAIHNGLDPEPEHFVVDRIEDTLDATIAAARTQGGEPEGSVEIFVWGEDPATRVVVVLDDYGHGWPDRPIPVAGDLDALAVTHNLDATDIILEHAAKLR